MITPEKQQVIGVQLGQVERKAVSRVLRTVGRVAADETRIYRIPAATPGWIEQALPNTVGSLVQKDERLASFYAREILGAQQAYFYALDAKDRFVQQRATEAQMASTNVQVQSSIDNLRALGMTASQIEELGRQRERVYTIDLRAPASGFILVRNVSQGQRFEPGDELYVIADLRRVWVLADLFEADRGDFTPGRTVRVRHQGATFDAQVSRVPPQFDRDASTIKVRLELDNLGYRLKPGMFVDVEFPLDLPPTLAVNADAVVDSGLRKTVFVDRGDGYFEPRRVETGRRLGDQVEITKGLMEGERIVTSGTFLIDSESRMTAAADGIFGAAAEDPVCGMQVDEKRAGAAGRTSQHEGRMYYFCADACKKQFDADPSRFAGSATTRQ
jgi:RND family efflux transporter MFP subunit